MAGFRHVVALTFQDGTPPEQIATIVARLRRLPAQIPELRSYTVGADAGLAPDNADLLVVADFDDQSGYETYRDHPAHQAVIIEDIRPHLAARTAVQHAIED